MLQVMDACVCNRGLQRIAESKLHLHVAESRSQLPWLPDLVSHSGPAVPTVALFAVQDARLLPYELLP